MRIAAILFFTLLCCYATFGQLGKDGSKTISGSFTSTNEYTMLTADATAGGSSISVANAVLTGANFSSPLATGDLIMIIQMQGATLSGADDSTFGGIVNYNNAGNYEFMEVASVNLTTINLNCGLSKNYSVSGKTQVIRVPRYASLTVNSAGILSCAAWNGSIGGVLAMEVAGNTIINSGGKIDVSGKGFRGGMLLENQTYYGVGNHRWLTGDYGAEKGEGIGGFQGDYDIYGGRYCRGAAANGGGGGNAHNAGGGGGSNGGNPAAWSGQGNPDISSAGLINAWNLEYMGFASSSSSGGGRGGYTFSGINNDATVTGPNNTAWGGDHRNNVGGFGGRPLDYSTGKIFIGGGGGAGDQNESVGGVGGAGGGLVYITSYGTVNGGGQIISNGANGANTGNSFPNGGTDGAGGGGAGGTVILNSTGSISGILITANGGNGGSQSVTVFDQYEAEGPGGGGSGGYIALSNGTATCFANGGANGTTNSSSFTEFPCNGATKGAAGIVNGTISAFSLSAKDTSVCNGSAATIAASIAGILPAGYDIYWYDSRYGGSALGNGSSYSVSSPSGNTTFYVGTCPGTYRIPVTITISAPPVAAFGLISDCASRSVQLSDSSTGAVSSWSWDFGDGAGYSSQQNPFYIYNKDTTYTITFIASAGTGCSDTVSKTVTFDIPPDVHFIADHVKNCDTLTVHFTNSTTNAVSYQWDFGDGTTSTDTSPSHYYNNPGIYNVTLVAVSSTGCNIAQSVIGMIRVDSLPDPPTIDQYGDSLVSSPASGYQWYLNSNPISGATNRIYMAMANGDYSVRVNNAEGCLAFSNTISVIVSEIDKHQITNVSIYPNPAHDVIEVRFGKFIPKRLELTDAIGRLQWQSLPDQSSENMLLDMKNLDKSVYFLTLYYVDKKVVLRVIKD